MRVAARVTQGRSTAALDGEKRQSLHIANALKKPLIALFGTTSPHRTGPYGGSHVHIIISPTSKATPEQPLVDEPECMAQRLVDAVWDVSSEMLSTDLQWTSITHV